MTNEVNLDDHAHITPLSNTTPTQQTQTQTQQQDDQNKGVSSASSQEKSTKEHERDPAVVYMPPPKQDVPFDVLGFIQQGINPMTGLKGSGSVLEVDHAMSILQMKLAQTCIAMLERWIEGLKEIARLEKNERNDPLRLTLEKFKDRLQSGEEGAVKNVAVMTAVLILGATFIGGLAGASAVTAISEVSFNLIVNSITSILPTTLGPMAAELGLIGAMFAVAAMYQATFTTLIHRGGKEGGNVDMEYARNFAAQVISLMSGNREVMRERAKESNNEFDNFLLGLMLAKMQGAEKLDATRKREIIAQVKIAILFNAVALLNKLEEGKLTDLGMAAVLERDDKKKIKYESETDPRILLSELIHEELEKIESEKERARVLEKVFAYYDTDPDVNSLGDIVRTISETLNSSSDADLTQTRISGSSA